MNGSMMQQPLLISSLLTHAERHHGEQEIVSRRVEGDMHRTTYRELAARSRRMANALAARGIKFGDRVATLAWNGYRHMELYYAASGSGAVLHTLNPRLHPDQVVWIADHAEDQILFFDLTFLPLIEAIASPREDDQGLRRHDRPGAHAGRQRQGPGPALLRGADRRRERRLRLARASTRTPPRRSATPRARPATRRARSTATARRCCTPTRRRCPTALNCSARDMILPVVPMFHVNAWGLPYVACMVGAKLVFPGPWLDGKSLHELFEAEGVTVSAGVPTVWQGLLTHVEANDLSFSTMRRTIIGGSACPPAMMRAFQERYDVQVLHAWGMTEMSPLGTVCTLKPKHLRSTPRSASRSSPSRAAPVFGVDMKIVGDDGQELPHDGKTSGELLVRGPWIIANYFKGEGGDPLVDGWFPTGDVATIDADGYMQITDRSKDVIKSGGEWIGSIDLENIAMAHPAVAMAACIGARHPKWDERPLLVVVKKPGAEVTRDELLGFYEGKIAKWWTPDDVVFVDAIPLGATGKMQKNKLREQFADHKLPTA